MEKKKHFRLKNKFHWVKKSYYLVTYISEEQIITFYRFDLIHVLCFSSLYINTIYEANWQVALLSLFTKFNFYSSLALDEYSFWTPCESEKMSHNLFSSCAFLYHVFVRQWVWKHKCCTDVACLSISL